ncbi:MAG: serine/threonine protein kinase [Bauldia sp.]|nr:serine/threonine protein kinase [Bauldia sp.]
MTSADTIHASAVAVGSTGVLIRGRSGSGKSALVLGLLDRDPDATRLVADDRVILSREDDRIVAAPPPALAGMLEVRGQGVVTVGHLPSVVLALVVDLLPAEDCPRLPEPAERFVTMLDVRLPRLMLPIGASDGPARVRFALRHRGAPIDA